MITIGDEDDFRHFLPRILELAVRDQLLACTEIVLGKLAYSNWRSWPQAERVAVEGFLREAWRWVRRRSPDECDPEVESWLCAIACTGANLRPYLDDWAKDLTREARANLEQFAGMKVLLDECLPRKRKAALGDHVCEAVPEPGLAGTKNGQLLSLAEVLGFEVFLTLDKSLRYQQNLSGRRISIIVLKSPSNRLTDLLPLMPACLAAIPLAQPGNVTRI